MCRILLSEEGLPSLQDADHQPEASHSGWPLPIPCHRSRQFQHAPPVPFTPRVWRTVDALMQGLPAKTWREKAKPPGLEVAANHSSRGRLACYNVTPEGLVQTRQAPWLPVRAGHPNLVPAGHWKLVAGFSRRMQISSHGLSAHQRHLASRIQKSIPQHGWDVMGWHERISSSERNDSIAKPVTNLGARRRNKLSRVRQALQTGIICQRDLQPLGEITGREVFDFWDSGQPTTVNAPSMPLIFPGNFDWIQGCLNSCLGQPTRVHESSGNKIARTRHGADVDE